MSRKKLKQGKDKSCVLLSKCCLLKSSLVEFNSKDDSVLKLKEALVADSTEINKIIGIFRKLILDMSLMSDDTDQFNMIVSIAISVIEHRPMRQIASKLIFALAKQYPKKFNEVMLKRKDLIDESIMFSILYCCEYVNYIHPSTLRDYWEKYFKDALLETEDVKFIFGCRAFNAYLGAIEKFHPNVNTVSEVVSDKTITDIHQFALDGSLNKDCRQVLGLICLALKNLSLKSYTESYSALMAESNQMSGDVDFYRYSLSTSMVTRCKELTSGRQVLYEDVLTHILNLALRTDIDKQFTISIFKTISLFLQSVRSLVEEDQLHVYLEEVERVDVLSVDREQMHPHSALTRTILSLIQVHWGNKLEAVRRAVGEIHSNLVQVISLLSGEAAAHSFLTNQVRGLLSLSWKVHGKFLALTQLVPIVGTAEILKLSPDLPSTILTTLATEVPISNHCAVLYYTLYKHDESASSQEIWLDPITRYLDNPFMCDVCLRPILEFDEGSLYYLKEKLNSQDKIDPLVRVLREGRRLGFLDIKFIDEPELFTDNNTTLFDVPVDKIKRLCDSLDDGKVLSVLSLISDTNKTALPMTIAELEVMLHIIKNNQIRQIPSFRKNLLDNIDKFLSRMNSSSPILTRLSKNRYTEEDEFVSDKASEMLGYYEEFITDSMLECFTQLIPSASFQRQVTVIGILEKFYTTLSNCKVSCLTEINDLNLHRLLCAVTSPFEVVRNCGLSCLQAVKGIPLHFYIVNTSKVLAGLTSPKGVQSQKLCSLFSFIMKGCAGRARFTPREVIAEVALYHDTFIRAIEESSSVVYQWVTGILAILDDQLEEAMNGMMKAATCSPIFPVLNLLDTVLKECSLSEELTAGEQEMLVMRLLSYSDVLIDELFDEPIRDESPEGLLLWGSVESGEAGRCGPQLLLSMIWRTIQSLCSCLVTVVSSNITNHPPGDMYYNTCIGGYLKELLVTVRHHGVFENVHSAFISYCALMWQQDKDLLLKWLEEVLAMMESCDNDMSYTRRSAGIPSLVQAILVTESGRNGKPLLRRTMARLLDLSEDGTLVTGRIHALHVLHTLLKDSKLAEYVVPFIGRAFQVSIGGFSETLWSLRNASTMVFTVLMTRLFNRTNQSKATTDAAFFTLFPHLHPYFMSQLARAADKALFLYHPGLYPTLLVLQRLTPCVLSTGDPALSLSCFIEVVKLFARSGVYKTRCLAAETLVNIIPGVEMEGFIRGQIAGVTPGVTQNLVHGVLLQVKQGLGKVPDRAGVRAGLLGQSWLLTHNTCPFTAALYLETLSDTFSGATPTTGGVTHLAKHAVRLVETSPLIGPGATLAESCVRFVMCLRSQPLTQHLLSLSNPTVTTQVFNTPDLQAWFRLEVEEVTGGPGECNLPAILLLLQTTPDLTETVSRGIYTKVEGLLESNPNPQTQTRVLEVLGHLGLIPRPTTAIRLLGALCSPLNPWEQRLLLPRCLQNIYYSINTPNTRDKVRCESEVLWSLANLLQDEDDGVRRNAATVVLHIIKHQNTDIASELVLPLLLSHLLSQSPAWCLELLKWIDQSEPQELVTSHYVTQYQSEGYAAKSRAGPPKVTPSEHTEHPLFEPDLVNPYAEPLCVPLTVVSCLVTSQDNVVTSQEGDAFSAELRALSHEMFVKYCSGGKTRDKTNTRDFVFLSKIEIFSKVFNKISKCFNVALGEDWSY